MIKENTCHPVDRVVDVTIEIDPPMYCRQGIPHKYGTPEWYEAYEQSLNHWAKMLVEFVRDHRSQDPVQISVNKKSEQFCSQCDKPWEEAPPENEGLLAMCSWCGRPVD